ncbi:MAG TPA: helix-turn-helix transcriptional regulator [Chloroflexia bacterium]|jgi:transcriptional regulator with XRE-family HTH domain
MSGPGSRTDSLSSLLKRHRRQAGLTQEKLAEKADVSVRAIQDIELGKVSNPREDTIRRLVEALGLAGASRAEFEAIARGDIHVPELTAGSGLSDPLQSQDTVPIQVTPYPGNTNGAITRSVIQPQPDVAKESRLPRSGTGDVSSSDRVSTYRSMMALILPITVSLVFVSVLIVLFISGVLRLAADRIPPVGGQDNATDAVPTQGPSVFDIVGGLQLSGLTKAPDGSLVVETGKVVTATFLVYNTSSRRGELGEITVGVRGPGSCTQNWNAPVKKDFPSVLDFVLEPGKSYTYTMKQTFEVPGVYFAEPVKRGKAVGAPWGGIRPHPRVWFRVVDAKTKQMPNPECITPVPIP